MSRFWEGILFALVSISFMAGSTRLLADFSDQRRSINNTGESLKRFSGEVWLNTASFGLTDNDMISGNTIGVTAGFFSLAYQHTFYTRSKFRFAPNVGVDGEVYDLKKTSYHVGGIIGVTRGVRNQHSASFGFRFRENNGDGFSDIFAMQSHRPFFQKLQDPDPDPESETPVENTEGDLEISEEEAFPTRSRARVQTTAEYDYYTDEGNLFFIGARGVLIYAGFTWAFENVHTGLVMISVNDVSLDDLLPFATGVSEKFQFFVPLPYLYVRF